MPGDTMDSGGIGFSSGLSSELLERHGFRHAFFTRRGGVSPAPWDTLNFAVSTGDEAARVAENRRRAGIALGVDERRLHYLSQVHGTAVRVLRADERPDNVVREVGDVTLSSAAGVACGVRSADCAPVLVADRRSGAVAAIHSGWRGTVARVVEVGVRALRELAGERAELVAAIGPHIERCCFEVGDDVAADLAGASSAGNKAVWAARDLGTTRPHVDLRVVLRAQLEGLGIAAPDIDDVAGCTVCDTERFFSFRRDGQRGGRLLSAIVARG